MTSVFYPFVGLLAITLVLTACANSGPTPPPSKATTLANQESEPRPSVSPPQEADPAQPDRFVLALIPLGQVQEETIACASHSIESSYGWQVDLLRPQALPSQAYYEPRRRYRAEKLLAWLHKAKPPRADKVMGLTEKDISTSKGRHKDWGICGLADLGGPGSVVSTFRIKRKLGQLPKEERQKKYLSRLTDLTAHEFGHQLGLYHCPQTGCIMEDAKGTVLTFNRSTGELCPACRSELARLGYPLSPP